MLQATPQLATLQPALAGTMNDFPDTPYDQELIMCRGEYLTLHSPVIYDCAEVKRLPFRVT